MVFSGYSCCHDIADVLLKVAFNTITLTPINGKCGNFNGKLNILI
jgi:hypothetical protein